MCERIYIEYEIKRKKDGERERNFDERIKRNDVQTTRPLR